MLIYQIIMGSLAPVLLGMTLFGRWRGQLGPGALGQRLGMIARRAADAAPAIWLHGASNGEVTSARRVLESLAAALPGLRVLVTANTGSAVALVQGWNLPGVQAALAPIDSWGSAGRVLARWRPALIIVVENELWPARLAAADVAGVPVALIGARLSEKSAAGWARLAPGLMRGMLARLRLVSAQDAASAARLQSLGLEPERLGPQVMLKAQVVVAAPPTALPQPLPRERVLLAASTHPGEEVAILQAFAAARHQFDLLILAPRHARRSAEVAGAITASGMAFTQRSKGALPAAGTPVFLADTMGEMPLWYAMAGATIIGGSFVPLGGHTPYEPAAAGSALLHGPHMENFAEPAAALAQNSGAVTVGRAGLAAALAGLTGARQAELAAAARATLQADPGAADLAARLVDLIRARHHQNGASSSG